MPAPDLEPTAGDDLLRRVKARGAQLRFRRQSRLLSGCIALLLVVALTAAGARGPGANTSLIADDPDAGATTTSAADSSASTTTPDDDGGHGSTTTTAGGGASPSTTTTTIASNPGEAAAPSTTAPEPVVRGPYDPPRSGSYRYRTQSDGTNGEYRLTYRELSRRRGETRLLESSDSAGGIDQELAWRPDGVFARSGDGCDEHDERTRFEFPLAVGNTWSSDDTCSSEDTGEIRTRTRSRVDEATKVTVAGESVDVFVVSLTGTVEITVAGVKQTHYVEYTYWFSPAHGVNVKMVTHTRQTEAKTAASNKSTVSELLSLDPE